MSELNGAEIRVFGAPQRVVAASEVSRLRSDALGVEIVEHGLIPSSVEQEIPILDPASNHKFSGWKGGVYDKDKIVCPASLGERDYTFVTAPYEPDEINADEAEYRPGEAVYAGLAFKHFGHFLLESTSRLWWPLLESFDGPIVFQNSRGRDRVPRFAQRLFELLGLGDRVIVTDRMLRFDRVIVPHSAFTIRRAVHPHFRKLFLVAGEAAERYASTIDNQISEDAAGVYLSRTLYQYRQSYGEQRVEKAFARNGFDIFHMENLPLEQQILAMRRYQTIAGIAGSAFHSMLFSEESKNAIYINRDYDINENFFMIDELMANTGTYLYNAHPADTEQARTNWDKIVDDYHSDTTLDVGKLFSLLERSRALAAPWRWRGY